MAKTVVMVLGVVFALIGLMGFFMESPLFGMFEVDTVHNWIHLLSGVVALALSRSESGAKIYAKVFGIVYALVTVLGFAMNGDVLGIFRANGADNILHLVLAAVLLWVGFAPSRGSDSVSTQI